MASAIMAHDEVQNGNDVSADENQDLLEGIPPLTTEIATGDDDIVAALKLVADSVAQQRNVAARVLIFHPLNVAIFTVLFSMLMQYLYKPGNFGKMLTTATGLIMMALVLVRQSTSGYIFAAEEINKSWLGEDQILISRFGETVIGALVLGWEKGEGRGNRRKSRGKGVVRAWTVKLRYRGKGVGTELLEEAVKETQKRGGEEIVFADDHASKLSSPYFDWESRVTDSLRSLEDPPTCLLSGAFRTQRCQVPQAARRYIVRESGQGPETICVISFGIEPFSLFLSFDYARYPGQRPKIYREEITRISRPCYGSD
jgi:GNAT superfamily N-acetyltransferase